MKIFLGLTLALCLPTWKSLWIRAHHEDHRDHGYVSISLLPREHWHYQVRNRELSASELMVDLTNELAYRLMYHHSVFNRNNFAFSPTALMSVLVALYEGSNGHSAYQLKNYLQLPSNRDTIRIGNRDIHRRLRTYFFGSENPLKGLSLNMQNISILPHYESILAFYGYDLSADMISQMLVENSSLSKNDDLDARSVNGSGSREEIEFATTNGPIVNITMNTDGLDQVEIFRPTMSPSNRSTNTPAIATTSPLIASTTYLTSSVGTTMATSTSAPITTKTTESTTTTTTSTTTSTTTGTTAATLPPTEATLVSGDSLADLGAELISSLINAANSETFARIQKNQSNGKLPIARLQAPPVPMAPRINYLPAQKKGSAYPHGKRYRRHLPMEQRNQWLISWYHTNFDKTNSYHYPITSNIPRTAALETNGESLPSEPWNINEPGAHFSPDSTGRMRQNYNTDVISHVFYLNNQRTVYTTFKVYNAVLYHKYFEQWHMSVIELELDTSEYNLMILLPDFHTDLLSATASLNFPTVPKLRAIRKQLKPKWVQAIIPDFRLHGITFLTNDLQSMGITDIFEPNRADFRSMTDEKGTYIKHIQQSIKIHIRTHPINQLKGNNGPQMQPIQISVNHPFIFFIVDRDLDVAVMAGRILNPLNVRIQ